MRYDKENKPGVSNLLTIYSVATNKTIEESEQEFAGSGYGDFKQAVADAVVAMLTPIQERYYEWMESDALDEVLDKGAERAQAVANKTLRKAKKRWGWDAENKETGRSFCRLFL